MSPYRQPVQGIILPCNGCTACCQRDVVLLDPKRDDPKKYELEVVSQFAYPVAALRHKENGDCWYLDRDKGCTIWERRPTHCKTLDCRVFLDLDTDRLVAKGILRAGIIQAAKDLAARMGSTGRRQPREEWKIPGKAQCRKQGKARKSKDK